MKQVSLVVITDGRMEYLERTIASAKENLKYPFLEKIMVNDSPSSHYELERRYRSEFKICSHIEKKGLASAVKTAWRNLNKKTDYVFHLEEDFTFNCPVNLENMIKVLEEHKYLTQMLLMRQPCNVEEMAVGGYQYLYDLDFEEITEDGLSWMEHRKFFSLNPGLYPINITKIGWPDSNEAGFIEELNSNPTYKSGVWGTKDQKPVVHHIGDVRSKDWKE